MVALGEDSPTTSSPAVARRRAAAATPSVNSAAIVPSFRTKPRRFSPLKVAAFAMLRPTTRPSSLIPVAKLSGSVAKGAEVGRLACS